MATLMIEDVSQDVLIWARESIGLTQAEAARKLGLSLVQLRMLEEGPDSPTLAQMRKMVDVYKCPLAVLLLPKPPMNFAPMRDFRLLPGKAKKPYSSDLRLAFRRAHAQQEVARELAEAEEEVPSPLNLVVDVQSDPEVIGDMVRAWLGTPLYQTGLSQWIDLIEAKTILVIHVSGINVAEMRGCSLSGQPFPVIMLNGKDAARARLFTLMHELVHILLHAGGVCDLEPQRLYTGGGDAHIERFCNHVAAVILMPRSSLLRDARIARSSPDTRWSDDDLERMADRYGVSREAVLLRLVQLGHATWDYYFSKQLHFHEIDSDDQDALGHPGYYRTHLRRFGRRYTAAVIEAYSRRAITASELSDYLEIRVNHLAALEDELRKRR